MDIGGFFIIWAVLAFCCFQDDKDGCCKAFVITAVLALIFGPIAG